MKFSDWSSSNINKKTLLKMANFFAKEEGTCLLYSGGDHDSANTSYLFLFPFNHFEIRDERDPWEVLKSKIDLNAFTVGFLHYEMGLKEVNNDFKAYFQQSAFILIVNHQTGLSKILIESKALNTLSDVNLAYVENFQNNSFFENFLKNLPEIETQKLDQSNEPLKVLKNLTSLENYQEKITAIKEMILNGDVYQVNLSHEIVLVGKRNPFEVFYKLMQMNPAPFSAYFKLKDFTLVSSSPERLLRKNKDILETRPIKGTIPRGKSESEDLQYKESLLNSAKDHAELLMITDLMRNDLGKISVAGSVKTLKISHLEAYHNVYHLLSIIQSNPMKHIHPVDLLKACFPGGSVTGCPKLMAMRVIKKIEKRKRGIYTGSIGYFNGTDFDFNIAIRTLVFTDDKINIQLGGAITIDSDPVAEYEETLQKGASIFHCLELIN